MNSNTCLIWAIWRSSTPRLLLLFWFLYAVQTWSSSVGKKNKMSENALMWLTAWDESRHEIFIFVDLPSQRRRCGHFGDVPAVCECPLLCPRCKGSHLQVKCEEPTHQCITCCKPYEVTYILCPYLQQEHSIPCRFSTEHNVSFAEARTAVSTRDGSPPVTKRTIYLRLSSSKAYH